MNLTGKQVVFLASIDWSAPWQRHQVWASAFAQAGHEVFFVENTGFRGLIFSDAGRVVARLGRLVKSVPKNMTPPGLHVISPALFPSPRGIARGLNSRILIPRLVQKMKEAGLKDGAIVFAYLPTHTTLEILDAIKPGITVYDCVDNFAGHPDKPKDLELTEFALLKRADAVFATSHFLYAKCRRVNQRVYELHHGVSEAFLRIASAAPLANYKKFCYFGTVWSALDYRPVAALGEMGFAVDMIGPVKEKPPAMPKSVRLRPAMVPAPELPGLIDGYDGILLPYADTAYNKGVLPAKTYECLATGKPVLANPIPELRRFKDVMYLPKTPIDWVKIVKQLPETETGEKREARIALARDHSTPIQFAKLVQVLEQTVVARGA